MKKTILLLIAISFIASIAFSEDDSELAKTLSKLAGSAAQGFVGPAGSGFGNNLNLGWSHKAPSSKLFGIDIEIGVVAAGTFVTDENKTFDVNGSFRFNDPQAQAIANGLPNGTPQAVRDTFIANLKNNDVTVRFAGPTVLNGDGSPVIVEYSPGSVTVNGQPYNVESYTDTLDGVKGFDLPLVPLFLPQISLGTVYGTSLTLRGAPIDIPAGDFGKVRFFGFGIQHNIGSWVPIPFVDVALAFSTTSFTVKAKQNSKDQELLKTKATSFGINVSKQFGVGFFNVTPYAGFGIENSNTTVSYDAPLNTPTGPVTIPFSVEFKGENKTRLTAGLSLRLGVININADYNLGKSNSASAGFFFAF